METATLLGFFVVSLIGIATPGPDVLLAMSNGSRYGLRRSLPGIAGVALSDLILMSTVAFGFGAILAASEIFFLSLKLLGVAYLTYLGLKLVMTRPLPAGIAHTGIANPGSLQAQLFTRSFVVALTNIKGWLFFAAFLPQFIDPERPMMQQYLILTVTFELLDIAVLLAYAAFGASAVRVFKGSTALWMDRVSGSILLMLAAALILYQRGGGA